MMNSLVSFIISAYKASFLEEAINSILAQTYSSLELIIVNDCSPDDIDSIVELYHDTRIKYYKNKENIGGKELVKQWNSCLKYADGEFVIMASDDDVYDPTYLEEMLTLASSHPDISVFHSQIRYIDCDGKAVSFSEPCKEVESCLENIYYSSVKNRMQTLQEFMFRTDKLKEIGGFVDFPSATASDKATCLLVGKDKGMACVNKYLFSFRVSNVNVSTSAIYNVQKINACEAYCDWLIDFSAVLKPRSSFERYVKSILAQSIKQVRRKTVIYMFNEMQIADLEKISHQEEWPYRLVTRDELKTIIRRKKKHRLVIAMKRVLGFLK